MLTSVIMITGTQRWKCMLFIHQLPANQRMNNIAKYVKFSNNDYLYTDKELGLLVGKKDREYNGIKFYGDIQHVPYSLGDTLSAYL